MRLVPVAQAVQDLDRVLHGRLGHQDRLEAALERGVLLDVLAVLVDRGGADDVQLAAGEGGLEHVARAHGALGRARADDGVQLVDEGDQLVAVLADLVDDLLQPLLEVAPVPGPGDQARQVEPDQALVAERVGHLAVDDALRDALHDRGLADAGLPDQHRVVLRPPRQHLDRLLDLVLAADHRVDAALAGHRGQIGAVLVDGGRVRRGPARRASPPRPPPAGRLLQRLRRDPRLPELPSGGRLGVDREREQQVLGPDVGRAERPGDLPGVEQRPLGRRGKVGGSSRGSPRCALATRCPGDGVGVGAGRGEQAADGVLARRRPEQVVGVQVGVAPLRCLGGGVPHQFAGLIGQQLADVDPLRGSLWYRPAEETREKVVEGTGTEFARPEWVMGHDELPD